MKQSTVPAEIRGLFVNLQTSLNALIEDPNVLGEPWRSQLLEIRGQINASLESLPPTDQVPAAQEARYGLDLLKSQFLCVQNIINMLPKVVDGYKQASATALASVTPEVEKQVDAKLKTGDFLKKEDAQGLIDKARGEGDIAGFNRGKLVGDRRTALALAGIPAEIAKDAPDAILLGEEKDFNAARDVAKERVGKLVGLGLASSHASVKTLAFAKPEDFDAQYSTFSELLKGKGQSNNGKVLPNPYLGGSTADNKDKPATRFNF